MSTEPETRTSTGPAIATQGRGAATGGTATWLVGSVYIAVAAVYLLVPIPESVRPVLGHAVLLASTLFAALACLHAARRNPPSLRLPWHLFAGAALVALVGQTMWAVQQLVLDHTLAYDSVAFYLLLIFHPLFAAGAAVALRPARRRRSTEVLIDGALITVASLLLVGRVSFEPLMTSPELDGVGMTTMILAQLGAVISFLYAALLVLWGDPVLPGRAVPSLAGAAAAFLATTIFMAAGLDPAPLHPGDPADLGALSGWFLLGAAGLAGVRNDSDLDIEAEAERARRRLRRAVAPGAALFLGAATIDAALHPGRLPLTAFAATCVAILLAVRIRLAVREAENRVDEGLKLAHTQALVELNRALAGATELNRTLDLVSQWACRLLDAGAAGIELLTEDGKTLEMRAACGLPSRILGMRFRVEGSFTGLVVQQRRARATVDPRTDPYIQPESAAFLGSRPTAAAPLLFGDRPLGALFAANRTRPFDAHDLELLRSLADQAALAIENARLFEQVHILSLTDPLTGLANRRQLERDLRRELAAAKRGRRLVLVLFDLDEFKEYNDQYGHLAGDEVLRAFGQVLLAETRAMNLAARYGGDEFLVLLADSDLDGAAQFVRRVARRFHEAIARFGRGYVSVSAGMAAHGPEIDSPEALIAAADRMLYASKGDKPPRSST